MAILQQGDPKTEQSTAACGAKQRPLGEPAWLPIKAPYVEWAPSIKRLLQKRPLQRGCGAELRSPRRARRPARRARRGPAGGAGARRAERGLRTWLCKSTLLRRKAVKKCIFDKMAQQKCIFFDNLAMQKYTFAAQSCQKVHF